MLKKLQEALLEGKAARSVELDKEELAIVKAFSLLTLKPMIYVANMSDEEIMEPEANPYYQAVKAHAEAENNMVVPICAKIEEELSALDKEEKSEFLAELGIAESGLDQIIKSAYHILNLRTFLTAGEDECRAWTFKKGMCCISALTYKRNEKERHPQMDMRHGEVAIRSGCLFYGKPERTGLVDRRRQGMP